MKVHERSQKSTITFSRVQNSEKDEWHHPSKKPKDFFGTRIGDAWPFDTKRHTFGASRYAPISSAGFLQNICKHCKIRNFVIWRSMANVKFTERCTANVFKWWIPLKVVWTNTSWCMNTSWHRSDALNGSRQRRNEAFDAFWCSTVWGGTERTWETTHHDARWGSWCTADMRPRVKPVFMTGFVHNFRGACPKWQFTSRPPRGQPGGWLGWLRTPHDPSTDASGSQETMTLL